MLMNNCAHVYVIQLMTQLNYMNISEIIPTKIIYHPQKTANIREQILENFWSNHIIN